MSAFALCLLLCLTVVTKANGDDRVLLRDVQVVTLYKDRMTTGRRSSPVPQLSCVGGSARYKYQPDVIQCYNRGSDGSDVQWECKADMPKKYKFGPVQVTCEGYGYPEDAYILKGSCGLEYHLEDVSSGSSYGFGNYYSNNNNTKGSGFGGLIKIGVIVFIFYIIFKTCAGSKRHREQTNTDSPPPYSSFDTNQPRSSAPPPPSYGFRSDLHDDTTQTRTSNAGGNFWTGAGTGGILGYLFGRSQSQDRGYYNSGYCPPSSSYFGGNTYSHHHHHYSSGGSSQGGTHTSSGFGGTKRR